MAKGEELREAAERTRRFPRHEDCPKGIEPGSGLSGSPRQSDFGTAVILGPDDYHALLTIRDHYLASRPAAEVPISEEWLREIGFVQDGYHLALQYVKPYGEDTATFKLIATDAENLLDTTWELSCESIEVERELAMLPCEPRTRTELTNLLTALGIEASR